MKNNTTKIILTTAALAAASCIHAAITTGGLAFVGFNADAPDDFAIVALENIAAGESVFFTEDEWNGSAFTTGESTMEWITPSLSAGTVITFTALGNSGTAAVSHGMLSFVSGSATALSVTSEAIYAFQGSHAAPTGFIAAIANNAAEFNGTSGTLSQTGLDLATTAVLLPTGTDGGAYTGPRSGAGTFADYLSAIANVGTYWQLEPSDGALVLPFDTTTFNTVAVPEPSMAATVLGVVALVALLRHRRRKHFA